MFDIHHAHTLAGAFVSLRHDQSSTSNRSNHGLIQTRPCHSVDRVVDSETRIEGYMDGSRRSSFSLCEMGMTRVSGIWCNDWQRLLGSRFKPVYLYIAPAFSRVMLPFLSPCLLIRIGTRSAQPTLGLSRACFLGFQLLFGFVRSVMVSSHVTVFHSFLINESRQNNGFPMSQCLDERTLGPDGIGH